MNHQRVLIATTNPAKFRELSDFLAPFPFPLVSLAQTGIKDQPEENGATFSENAVIKARFYGEKSSLPTLADDGGFEIDALGGEPGVKSHRYVHPDRDSTDEELIGEVFRRLNGVPLAKRTARLSLVLAFSYLGRIETAAAMVAGVIPEKPAEARTPGFPYRSVLYLPEFGKFYNENELTKEENDQVNHRKKAVSLIKPKILRCFDIISLYAGH